MKEKNGVDKIDSALLLHEKIKQELKIKKSLNYEKIYKNKSIAK